MKAIRLFKKIILKSRKNYFSIVILSVYFFIDRVIRALKKFKLSGVKRLLIISFNKITSRKKFSLEFLKNKTVAIVGPANSLFDEEKGDYIDRFDIVVRINNSINNLNFELYQKYSGKKTTILFHGLDESPKVGCGKVTPTFWKKMGVEFVFYPLNEKKIEGNLENYFYMNSRHLPIMQINKVFYQEIVHSLNNYRPSTGFAALYIILQAQFKELYITGFTFFKTPHIKGYREEVENHNEAIELIKKFNIHNPENEFQLFSKMVKSSKGNIGMDRTLSGLIYPVSF